MQHLGLCPRQIPGLLLGGGGVLLLLLPRVSRRCNLGVRRGGGGVGRLRRRAAPMCTVPVSISDRGGGHGGEQEGGVGARQQQVTSEVYSAQPLGRSTLRALRETLEIEHMTEIQARTLAPALAGKDILGRARTGTGKTLAFLVPALERLAAAEDAPSGAKKAQVRLLAISPTRELAAQISSQVCAPRALCRFRPWWSVWPAFVAATVAMSLRRA
jgi:hypothetical protein